MQGGKIAVNLTLKYGLTLLIACGCMPAFGTTISIFNTGESASGPALSTGVADPHYSLVSAPAGVSLTAITTQPVYWTSNTSTADWISPGASGAINWPVGNYDYQTTFSLAGDNPATAQLSGSWASDNNGCIYLNGVNTNDCTTFAGFTSLTSFSITSGFVAGTNTLDFEVYNGGGPSGVFAQVSGTANPTSPSPTPESSSWILAATGLLGAAGMMRRRILGR